jgi:hypothetical protein
VHRTILVVDVERFSAQRNEDQVTVRPGLYLALGSAFAESGIARFWRRGNGYSVWPPETLMTQHEFGWVLGHLSRA